tara:strand:+ start:391 stop:636 length:246 start_codon:yes stop_codon:yes gene_type:complete
VKKVHSLFQKAPESYSFSSHFVINITLLIGFCHWLGLFYLGVHQAHDMTILLVPLSLLSWLAGLIFVTLILRIVIFDIILA